MEYRIRPVDVQQDVAAIASLWQYVQPEPPTPEELARAWSMVPPEGIRHRLVAVAESGAVAGFAAGGWDPWDEAGRWFTRIVVAPEFRRQGLGADLYERLVTLTRRDGATVLVTEVRDNEAASQAWAADRGFRVDRHLFESVLDLTTFDDSRFAGVVESVVAGGIRFVNREVDASEAMARKVWAMMERTVRDIPGIHIGGPVPFADWCKWALDDQRIPRDCFHVAFDGDSPVGVTFTEKRSTGAMYTSHTSVDPEYRGRRVALALKLLSVQACRRHGAPYMRTNNDSQNGPMLAVNRKLGYQPEPGVYLMEKPL